MAILPIYNSFHPVLKQKAIKVETIDDDVRQFVSDMYETLYNISNGVGLAANQVGDRRAIVIIDLSVGDEDMEKIPLTMVNPVIEEFSEEEADEMEGCLSSPDLFEKVVRPASISVRYFDMDMKEHADKIDGFLARVMQHEIDHINGINFFEKLTGLRKTMSRNKLKKIKRGSIYTDYPMILADGKPSPQ